MSWCCLPVKGHCRPLKNRQFRGSITRLEDSLSTLRSWSHLQTTQDSLLVKGFAIGPLERVTDHYRRFIDVKTILAKLEGLDFKIEFSHEGRGMAVLGSDDPIVGRIVARRRVRSNSVWGSCVGLGAKLPETRAFVVWSRFG